MFQFLFSKPLVCAVYVSQVPISSVQDAASLSNDHADKLSAALTVFNKSD